MCTPNLQILNMGHAIVGSNWNWNDVDSPFTRIYCVTDGHAWIIINSRRVQLLPGMLYIVPAYTRHSYRCEKRLAHYYAHVYESVRSGSVFDRYEMPVEVRATAADRELFENLCGRHPECQLPAFNPEEYDNTCGLAESARRFCEMDDAEKMYIRGAVLMLLSRFVAEATPRATSTDQRIERAISYIDEHLDSAIRLDTLAAKACMSKAYLIRMFRLGFGITPMVYINRRRIEKAQLLLLTTTMPIKEIGYTLGFEDNSYFCRLFKKYTGHTPKSYRTSN